MTMRTDGVEVRYYVCPDNCCAKTMVWPIADRIACPRLSEHSECHWCGKVLIELDGPGGQPLEPQPPRPHLEDTRVDVGP